MSKNRALIAPLIVLALVLAVVAVIYLVDPAKSLPGFFPGHDAASTHHHTKHGVAALLLALGCLVLAWFQTGPARPAGQSAK